MADTTMSAVPFEPARPRVRPMRRRPIVTRLRSLAALALPPAVLAGAWLLLWDVLTERGIVPRYILPSPLAVLHEITVHGDVLVRHGIATTREALSGFAIGNVSAVLLALLFAGSAPIRRCFYPLALVSRGVPIIAITPLLVLVFGRGLPPIVAVVSIAVSFPTFLNMVRGLQSADVDCQEMLHSLSATPWQRLRLIEIPASIPYLFAALKVSASTCFISALVAEWIGTNIGLGYLVVISGQYFKLPMLWAAIATAAALTLAMLGLVALAERLLHRWTAAPAEL